MKEFASHILTCLLTVLVCFLLFRGCDEGRGDVLPAEVRVDTVILHDTVTVTEAIRETRTIRDTILIAIPMVQVDTVRDTVMVRVQREDIVWQDTLCTIYAHGYETEIDSVAHYITERTVTRYVTKERNTSRWGLGIHAGWGASTKGLSPYIGIGIHYTIIQPRIRSGRRSSAERPEITAY